jgi:hypothetical protein
MNSGRPGVGVISRINTSDPATRDLPPRTGLSLGKRRRAPVARRPTDAR